MSDSGNTSEESFNGGDIPDWRSDVSNLSKDMFDLEDPPVDPENLEEPERDQSSIDQDECDGRQYKMIEGTGRQVILKINMNRTLRMLAQEPAEMESASGEVQ